MVKINLLDCMLSLLNHSSPQEMYGIDIITMQADENNDISTDS